MVGMVVATHGLFCALYTDRGSHYFETAAAGARVSKTVLTQFGRALKQLGIEHIAAYSPQARGRSERLFGTLQDRLPKELALAGIATLEAANRWLREVYIAAHNARFAVPAEQEGSAFVADPTGAWRDILCIQEDRGSQGGQRQHGEVAPPEPAAAAISAASALRQGNRAGARCTNIPMGCWRCSGGRTAWRTTMPAAASSNTSNWPHDTLPARPLCAGACPGTEHERSGQITRYQNRTD